MNEKMKLGLVRPLRIGVPGCESSELICQLGVTSRMASDVRARSDTLFQPDSHLPRDEISDSPFARTLRLTVRKHQVLNKI